MLFVVNPIFKFRETAVLRYVLKHLRQRRLLTPYQTILSRANIQLEHPLVTQLHESLVLQGNWSKAENLLDSISSANLFDSYLNSCQPHSVWTRLHGTDPDGDVPPARGGHAMCMDPVNDVIYIFGGWDGKKSLDDFWAYNIKEDKWKVLSHSTTQEQNAPEARSCHKMVFDTKTGSIYVLGRLNDSDGLRAPEPASAPTARSYYGTGGTVPPQPPQPQAPPPQAPPQTSTTAPENPTDAPSKTFSSEFYRYHTRGVLSGKWDFLSIDTAVSRPTLQLTTSNLPKRAVLRWPTADIRPSNGYGFGCPDPLCFWRASGRWRLGCVEILWAV